MAAARLTLGADEKKSYQPLLIKTDPPLLNFPLNAPAGPIVTIEAHHGRGREEIVFDVRDLLSGGTLSEKTPMHSRTPVVG